MNRVRIDPKIGTHTSLKGCKVALYAGNMIRVGVNVVPIGFGCRKE